MESRRYLIHYDADGSSVGELFEGHVEFSLHAVEVNQYLGNDIHVIYGDGSNEDYFPGSTSSDEIIANISHDFADQATITAEFRQEYNQYIMGVEETHYFDVLNVQPTGTLAYDPGDGGGDYTLSLNDPEDPSSADTTAGFRYSSAGLYANLAGSYGEADTDHSFTFDDEDADGVVWIRIFDKDGGYSDYNTSYILPTVNVLGVTAGSIAISWNANVVDGETSWIIQRALESGGAFSTVDTLAGNAGSYVDDDVSPNTRYIYRVRAAGSGAETAYSAKRFIRTLMPTPTNVAATDDPDAGTVEVTWDAASGYTYDHFEIGVYNGGEAVSDESLLGTVDVDGDLRSYTFTNPSRLPLQFTLVSTSALDNRSTPTPPTESVITGWGWVTIADIRYDPFDLRNDLDPIDIPGVEFDLNRNPPFGELEDWDYRSEDTAVWTVSGLPHHSRIRVVAADVSTFGDTDDGWGPAPQAEFGPHVTAQIIGSGALVPEKSRWPDQNSFTFFYNNWTLTQATPADRYYQHYGSTFKLAQTGYLLDETWVFRPDNLVLQLYMPAGVPHPDWDRNAPPPPPQISFNTPDPEPPLPPLPPLPPNEPPIEPIEEEEPEPEPSEDPELTENWDNLVIGGWSGFWSQYGWPYNTASTIETMGYSNSDDETEPGNPPPLNQSVFIPVNDGFDEGNHDYESNPVPDNAADAFAGHRVDYDVAPMWLDLWTTDESTDAGSVSLSYDSSKLMLWTWSEDDGAWVELDGSTITLEEEKWSDGSYERLYFLAEGIAGSDAVHDVPVTASFSKGDAGTAEDTAGFTVTTPPDIDVDSDNDDGYSAPERNDDEDPIEADTGRPGKIVLVNDDDDDGDGIPDFADGFNLNTLTGAANDDSTLGEEFAPIIVELPELADPSECKVVFFYDASNPGSTTAAVNPTTGLTTYTAGSGSIRLWTKAGNVSRNKSFLNDGGDFIKSNFEYDWTEIAPTGRTVTLWLEAVKPGNSIGDKPITFALDADGAGELFGYSGFDKVRLTAIKVDLSASKIDHNASGALLEEAVEESVGAFLPVNNDDDDYDSANSPDSSQTGAISGESDLLPVTLSKPSFGAGGKYKLTIPSHIKVWQNSDRTGAVTSSTELTAGAAGLTVYAEGVSAGSGLLKMDWIVDAAVTLTDVDRIKITTFDWSGALNVPGYSIHEYKVTGAPTGGKWIAPSGTGSSIKTTINDNDVKIQWGQGANVEYAVYQAHANYIWELEVNVVKIEIKTTGNQLTVANPPVQSAVVSKNIESSVSTNGFTMISELSIAVSGPTVGGSMRGIKFIEMGFMQNVSFPQNHADYNQLPKQNSTGNGRRRKLIAEGNTWYIDTFPASTAPWYDTIMQTSGSKVGFLAPINDNPITNRDFRIGDWPNGPGTSSMILNDFGNVDDADRFEFIWDFWTYFSARTKQAANNSENIYTQLAKKDWRFDGSGNVAAGVWTATSSNSGTGSFAPVTNGDVVPVVGGTIANAVPYDFTTVDQ